MQRCLASGEGVAKGQVNFSFKIGATLRSAAASLSTASTAASPAKHAAKQIAEIGAFIAATTSAGIETGATAATAKSHSTHWTLTANLVVLGAFGFIADNVVGRRDFLELVFC
jgi:hypothetical protein